MNPEFRALFPGALEQVYMNVAARGLVPTTVRDVVNAYLDDCVAGVSDKDVLRELQSKRDGSPGRRVDTPHGIECVPRGTAERSLTKTA